MLIVTDPRLADHVPGRSHPERPDRLEAALAGVRRAGVDLDEVLAQPRSVTRAELERVHEASLIEAVEAVGAAGGGRLDPDTRMSEGSLEAARLAAGAVLTAVEQLSAGVGDNAYCVVRPPGHHATADRSMGFCVFNSVAVAAAHLAARGERVAIVDIDAHHGNGTQEIFYESSDVLYASIHQWPLYPGTGAVAETGAGAGSGATLNVPLPPGATGDVARAAVDDAIGPWLERWQPGWLLVSAGYDAHRADPLTDLAWSAGDFADLVGPLVQWAPSGRLVVVLEGGYDLDAVAASSEAVTAALLGERIHPETPTAGGPGREMVELASRSAEQAQGR